MKYWLYVLTAFAQKNRVKAKKIFTLNNQLPFWLYFSRKNPPKTKKFSLKIQTCYTVVIIMAISPNDSQDKVELVEL